MTTTQVREDNQLALALVSLEDFALNLKFTRRDGYGVRCDRQPPEIEPLPNDEHPEQAQIFRLIRGPGNAIYGDVQPDGTITLKMRVPRESASSIDVAAAVEGYGRLTSHLTKKKLTYDPDKGVEEGVLSCSKDLGYVRRKKLFVSKP